MGKIQKNSNRKPCDWRKHQASRLRRSLARWGSPTARFLAPARNEQNTEKKHFQVKGIKQRLKREVARLQQERDTLKKRRNLDVWEVSSSWGYKYRSKLKTFFNTPCPGGSSIY